MTGGFDEPAILAIERPHRNLWTYYILVSLAGLPAAPVLLAYHWFRYHTLKYHFTAEGVSMSWGILFRRQILLNYARIQDIHLQSNLVERWLGLARLLVQTASGDAGAEMTIEGLKEFEAVRDFLYSKMRGVKEAHPAPPPLPAQAPSLALASSGAAAGAVSQPELAAALREVAAELRRVRQALERTPAGRAGKEAARG